MVNTFTVGFREQAFDERSWAREVSSQYGTRHSEKVVVPDDIADAYEMLLWHYDEPFNDYSFIPTYYLCREAKKDITVALSGDGADELFAGYLKYQRIGLRVDIERFIPGRLSRMIASAVNGMCIESSRLRQKVQPYAMTECDMLIHTVTNCFALPFLRAAARGPLRMFSASVDGIER